MERKDLTLEQEYALQSYEEGHNIFVTGPGGTGKTCLIKQIVQSAEKRNKKIQVCAMTGCAAILLGCKATTLHSWSGLKLAKGTLEELYTMVKENKMTLKKWKYIKTLIVDEVSMLSKRLFDILNVIGQRLRNSPLPFGGIQLVFMGDFYQLPPVGAEGDGQFCFESDQWDNVFMKDNHIALTQLFRQKDVLYKSILNDVRVGIVNEQVVKHLTSCLNKAYDAEKNNGCVPTKLFATKQKVDEINQQMFYELEGNPYEYEMIAKSDCNIYMENGKSLSLETMMKCQKELTTRKKEFELEYLKNNIPCDKKIVMKKGCNVMCTVNLDLEAGISNGSIGTIVDFAQTASIYVPIVLFSNGVKRTISVKYWQSEEYPTLAVGQIPLKLAWAMTIHKIQGATMSLAEIDIGRTIFECGQTYVALSRVQTLEGLYLRGFDPTKIKINPKVSAFYQKIPTLDLEEDEETEETENADHDVKTTNLFASFMHVEKLP